MSEQLKNNKLLILLLLTGAVYFFLRFLAPLLAPILVAMLFVTIFGPLLQKIQKSLRIHRQIGAVLLLASAGLVVGILMWVLISWGVGSLPKWIGNLEQMEKELEELVHAVCLPVGNAAGVDRLYLEETILSGLRDGIDSLQAQLMPGVFSGSWVFLKKITAAGGFFLTFLIATVLLAKDYDDIMNRLLDREEFHLMLEVIVGIIRYLATFVKAQLIIICVIGAVAALTLSLAGITNGVIWGVLAGLLDALPFVGTGIVLVPTAFFQIVCGNYLRGGICIILYVVCIILREFLEPKLIGKKMGLSPLAILLSLYVGIKLFGVLGVIKGPLGFVMIYLSYNGIRKRKVTF